MVFLGAMGGAFLALITQLPSQSPTLALSVALFALPLVAASATLAGISLRFKRDQERQAMCVLGRILLGWGFGATFGAGLVTFL